MTVDIGLLKSFGLTAEQIAQITAQQSNAPASPTISEKSERLSRQLDRILCDDNGAEKWTTDPTKKLGFLFASNKPQASSGARGKPARGILTSKSMEALGVVGKENVMVKRSLEAAIPPPTMKRAKSSDALSNNVPSVPSKNVVNTKADYYDEDRDEYFQRPQAPEPVAISSPAESPKQPGLYSWESPKHEESQPIQAAPKQVTPTKPALGLSSGLKNGSPSKASYFRTPIPISLTPVQRVESPETCKIQAQVTSPAKDEGQPRRPSTPAQQYAAASPAAASQQHQFYAELPVVEPQPSRRPSRELYHLPEPKQAPPQVKEAHRFELKPSKTEPQPVQIQVQVKEQPKPAIGLTFADLYSELCIPTATSSVCVEASPCPQEDKYGCLYEIKAATSATQAISPMESEFSDQQSCIQSEPIMNAGFSSLLSAKTELSFSPACIVDDGPDLLGLEEDCPPASTSLSKPNFTGVLQQRFTSKYADSKDSLSQLTMVGSTSSSALSDLQMDIFSVEGEQPHLSNYGNDQALSQYPLLSPSYSNLLRQSNSPIVKKNYSDSPEFTSLQDPQTSALLAGVREEIAACDKALYLSYRNSMRHKHTALPLSFQELKQKIEEYGLDINFREEKRTADVKQLFLLPLNNVTVPRWIQPGTSFRIGRASNWFLAQTRVVSRNHCEIFHDVHSYYVKDVGSRSGTYVNGTRIGEAEAISKPRELRHGDILQIGVDYASEKDYNGNIPDRLKCGQCIVLYGYKARAAQPLRDEISELKPTERTIESAGSSKKTSFASPIPSVGVSDSKFERMARKALAMKSRLASANTRLYIEFGDYISQTSAGTAILHRPEGEPSYSFVFNNYKMSWDIGMTCRQNGKHLGLSLASVEGAGCQVYKVFEGYGMEKCVATVTVQGEHKCLLEPVYTRTILDEQEEISERDIMNRSLLQQQHSSLGPIAISSPSPYLYAGVQAPASPSILHGHIPSIATALPITEQQQAPSTNLPSPTPRNPFYTLTGDLSASPASSLSFYVQRYANCRKQVFLGEGQVSSRKSAWGKKTIFYEARLPEPEQHDDLLALMSLFNVLNQLEKI